MKKIISLTTPFSFLTALIVLIAAALPAQAASPGVMLEQRLKASFNGMVQDVREEKDPAAKREILQGFLTRMDKGLALVEKMADKPFRLQATSAREKIQADLRELGGMATRGPNAGDQFNAYAAYLQQDVEQADGVYLSVGALIIILLILIILL